MKIYRCTNSRIDLEASEWVAQLGNSDPASASQREEEFAAWLQQSAAHVRAFLEASDAFYRLDGLTSRSTTDIRQLIGNTSSNVAALPTNGVVHSSQATRSTWRIAAVAAFTALIVGSSWLGWSGNRSHIYKTAIGEQRTVKLDDGSFVRLNTRSRIAVKFSSSSRQITLVDGEALFTVTHDANRPFVVRTGETTVRAVGTAFNVYRRANEVQVAVVEGRVQVFTTELATDLPHQPTSGQAVLLGEGDEVQVVKGKVSRKQTRELADATAWQQRRLIFKDTPLAVVADEFNRYNKTQMRVEGAALQTKALTGIFSADHPESLILYLSEFSALQVSQEGENWVVRAP